MSTRPTTAQHGLRRLRRAQSSPLPVYSLVPHRARMSSDSASRVRRFVKAARELKGWNQRDLADHARISRGTVQNLENGAVLTEGKEAAIENALGWAIGSIDQIRSGGLPTVERPATRIPTIDELLKLPVTEIMRVLDRVEELNGKKARDSLRDDLFDYMRRTTQGKTDVTEQVTHED